MENELNQFKRLYIYIGISYLITLGYSFLVGIISSLLLPLIIFLFSTLIHLIMVIISTIFYNFGKIKSFTNFLISFTSSQLLLLLLFKKIDDLGSIFTINVFTIPIILSFIGVLIYHFKTRENDLA